MRFKCIRQVNSHKKADIRKDIFYRERQKQEEEYDDYEEYKHTDDYLDQRIEPVIERIGVCKQKPNLIVPRLNDGFDDHALNTVRYNPELTHFGFATQYYKSKYGFVL